jgi:dephospho-CoA kinase
MLVNRLSRDLETAHQPNFDSSGPTVLAVKILGDDIMAPNPEALMKSDWFFAEIDLLFDTLGEYLFFVHEVVRVSTLDIVRRLMTYSRTRSLTLNRKREIIEPPD